MDIRIPCNLCSDPRFGALHDKRGGTRSEIVGNLVQFWMATRRSGETLHTREALLAMMPGRAATRESMLADLLEAGFLHRHADEAGDEAMVVVDDEEHLRRRGFFVRIGQKGGLATVKRRTKPRSEMSPRAHRRAKSPNEAPTALAWEAYREAYEQRWRVEPVRNKKVNGMMAQFVARIGVQDSPEVLRFYLAHNDGFYVAKQHDLALALRDAEALSTQWRRGAPITRQHVREHENADRMATQMELVKSIGFGGS